ncbi:hypothetical protein [Micromonospora echinofusca]|uniref:DUF5666 domain-containing protein n=1 Tax=Micromonospora echinofusca TaxID=47858 RepID=A0ABS3VLC2_MICEH|nr:hypothetical protein [Micromonospora echinofusca]MBO4205297.1 hypothetical protein [Micromonospora echinofusca]
MARWGVVTTGLLAAVALGVSGCGGTGGPGAGSAAGPVVDVVAALGAEGQALAALGFDAADLDVEPVAAPAPSASTGPERGPRGERGDGWRKRHQARVLLRKKNTLHGEVVVQTKEGTKTVAVQRGEVTAVDGKSVTVKSSDGFTMTWSFGENLRVVERRTTIQPSAVAVGATIGVAGTKDGTTAVARLILLKK